MLFARPNADISGFGWSSTESTLYAAVNEASANDATIIQSTDTAVFEYEAELGLSTIVYPNRADSHSVRVRAQKSSAASRNLYVELRQASTIIASWTIFTLTTSLANYDLSLTSTEAGTITHAGDTYAGLSLYFRAIDAAFGSPNRVIISQMYLTTPDPAFDHATIQGPGIKIVGPVAGELLTMSGGGYQKSLGTEGAGSLVLSAPWLKAAN